jgi:hypothetical protein
MKGEMALRVLVVALVVGAVFGAGRGPASADHGWRDYHWPHSGAEARVRIVDSVTNEWNATLNQAVDRWNRSVVLRGVIDAGDLSGRRSCTPARRTVRVCNDAYGTSGDWNRVVGLTTIRADAAGHILEAKVQFNESYLDSNSPDFRYLNDPTAWREVVCHELGHAFGLDHNSGNGSCLRAVIAPGGFFPTPNGHDYEQLEINYHRGRNDPRGSAAPATEETIADGPPRLDPGHDDDHTVRVRDLGNGETEVTIIRRVPKQRTG